MKFDIRQLESTASTNDDICAAAEAGAADGLVIRALRQSAGRGRQGRAWQSPEGNLYFSILLRPSCPIRDYGFFAFVAALAVGDAIAALLPEAKTEFKWPNDVLVAEKKISGILLESGDGFLIVGIGVNVAVMPENPLYPATCLAAQGGTMPPEAVLDKILSGFVRWRTVIEKDGFAPLRAAWLEKARRGVMRARLPQEEIHGTFADLDENGFLSLILADGTVKKINTGDVFF